MIKSSLSDSDWSATRVIDSSLVHSLQQLLLIATPRRVLPLSKTCDERRRRRHSTDEEGTPSSESSHSHFTLVCGSLRLLLPPFGHVPLTAIAICLVSLYTVLPGLPAPRLNALGHWLNANASPPTCRGRYGRCRYSLQSTVDAAALCLLTFNHPIIPFASSTYLPHLNACH